MNSNFFTNDLKIDFSKYQFKQKTNWVVITGAPCTGKTTVIEELKKLGHTCHPEAAREYIESEMAKGFTLDEIRADNLKLQSGILNKKMILEENLTPNQLIFLDRGIPDTLTYYRPSALDPMLALDNCFINQYDKVFVFD